MERAPDPTQSPENALGGLPSVGGRCSPNPDDQANSEAPEGLHAFEERETYSHGSVRACRSAQDDTHHIRSHYNFSPHVRKFVARSESRGELCT